MALRRSFVPELFLNGECRMARLLTTFAVSQARLHTRGHMSFTKNPGRFAGLLYVVTSIVGFFAMDYVPGKVIVHGNAAATANNILAHETLFRFGIAGEIIGQAGFIFVALALYDLLKGVSRRYASLMVMLIVISVPIAFVNELNSIAAIVLVRGADFLSVLDKTQREALAMLFIRLHGQGFVVAEIFWGCGCSRSGCWCTGRASCPGFWESG
jgi:Domain of unknown function (DUF4386)